MKDLSSKWEKVPPEYETLAGRAFTSTVVANEVDPMCNPLREFNKIVIAPGLLAGTNAPSSGRMSVGGKSPLTGGIKESNAGGITGGLTTGQPIVVRLAVKPTPTIAKPQHTIDKYTLENKDLAAITRRDPTIVARIWPVAEAYTALVILDHLTMHYGYQALRGKIEQAG